MLQELEDKQVKITKMEENMFRQSIELSPYELSQNKGSPSGGRFRIIEVGVKTCRLFVSQNRDFFIDFSSIFLQHFYPGVHDLQSEKFVNNDLYIVAI